MITRIYVLDSYLSREMIILFNRLSCFLLPPPHPCHPCPFLQTRSSAPACRIHFAYCANIAPQIPLHNSKSSVQELSWTKTFKKHCLSRDVCVQLHTKGKFKVPTWLRGVMGKNRGLKFVSINRNLHKTSFDHVVRTPRTEDTAKVAVMRRHKEGDVFSYTLTPHKGDFTETAVLQFINDVAVQGIKNKDTVSPATYPSPMYICVRILPGLHTHMLVQQ